MADLEDDVDMQEGSENDVDEEVVFSSDDEPQKEFSDDDEEGMVGLEDDEEEEDQEEDDDDEEEDSHAFNYDEDNEQNLQKFDQSLRSDYLTKFHPESQSHNFAQVQFLTQVLRHPNGIVIDEKHKTLPFLTKYERTRILGQRAKQINAGAEPCVPVPPEVIDGYLIATLELHAKKIPFIIKRTFHNGDCEYWNVRDLELI
jgi:DNA-directed RNA polymerase subunit K/omega